jgi:hypothetical protein
VGLPDGSAWASDELVGEIGHPETLGRTVAARMKLAGASELLTKAQQMAPAT